MRMIMSLYLFRSTQIWYKVVSGMAESLEIPELIAIRADDGEGVLPHSEAHVCH
jgi:hypothetical protein